MVDTSLWERYKGSILGLAVGDALGAPAEFLRRGTYKRIERMAGGGLLCLEPGEWTDDTAMARCLGESLLSCNGFCCDDQLQKYLRWWKEGYLSCNGTCIDIGWTTRQALQRLDGIEQTPLTTHLVTEASNGSIVRIAPVCLYYYPNTDAAIYFSGQSSKTTHESRECVDACRLLATYVCRILTSRNRDYIFDSLPAESSYSERIKSIAEGSFTYKHLGQIFADSTASSSLEAALWCFWNTKTFRECLTLAVNLGEDTDSVGALCGQLAGAYYGASAIPSDWLKDLKKRDELSDLAARLFRTNLE